MTTIATTRHEGADGLWEMVSRAPHPSLARYVRRYAGWHERWPGPLRRYELPFDGVVLIINFGPRLRVSDPTTAAGNGSWHDTFVTGLWDRPALTEHGGESSGMQVDLTPLGLSLLLDRPLGDLANLAVPLDEVLGRTDLAARLVDRPGWAARFELLDTLIATRLAAAAPPRGDVWWAWDQLVTTHGAVEVGALSERLGCSRRHLSTRFREHVGLPPKTVGRILRFRRALTLVESAARPPWAEVAATAGYYDQSHLVRDVREFAGMTPGELVAARLPDGAGLAA
jgi:AraC-like DNA-binding protein